MDWAVAETMKTDSAYAGKLDPDRIIAAGNSCGGVTAMELAAQDTRVRSVFVLSGSSALGASDEEILEAISVPVAVVVGNPDEDIAAPNALMDYELLPMNVPAMVVSRSSGDHPTVSTDVNISGDVADIALNWFDFSLFGLQDATNKLTSSVVCDKCESSVWSVKSKNFDALKL